MELTYRDILQRELGYRLKKNGEYSLRAFARDIGLDAGYLSHLFKKKRKLSVDRAIEVSRKLKFKKNKHELFLALVKWENSGSGDSLESLNQVLKKYRNVSEFTESLEIEKATAISDWYHYAILELTLSNGVRLTPQSVVGKLGISPLEAKLGIERLKKLGLLIEQDGVLKKSGHHLSAPDEVANLGLQNRQKQILSKAMKALEQQSLEERDYQTVTMSIDPNLLPEAKEKIRRFLFELCEFLESGTQTTVYEMSLQLFSLEKSKRKAK